MRFSVLCFCDRTHPSSRKLEQAAPDGQSYRFMKTSMPRTAVRVEYCCSAGGVLLQLKRPLYSGSVALLSNSSGVLLQQQGLLLAAAAAELL